MTQVSEDKFGSVFFFFNGNYFGGLAYKKALKLVEEVYK